MSQTKKLESLKQLIEAAEISLQQARSLLNEMTGKKGIDPSSLGKAKAVGEMREEESGQIIEGVFDGQNMIGPDGKQYSVPANYASKSKLVEGDVLKLTIGQDGSFVYKQIGPIERKRIKGTLTYDEVTDEFRVLAKGKAYRVLMASVTYFKGEKGDEVVLLVPKDKESSWGAVENIIKKVFLEKGEEEKTKSKETEERGEIEDNLLVSKKEEQEPLPEDKEKIYTFPESDETENLSSGESDQVVEKETDDLDLGEDEFEKL